MRTIWAFESNAVDGLLSCNHIFESSLYLIRARTPDCGIYDLWKYVQHRLRVNWKLVGVCPGVLGVLPLFTALLAYTAITSRLADFYSRKTISRKGGEKIPLLCLSLSRPLRTFLTPSCVPFDYRQIIRGLSIISIFSGAGIVDLWQCPRECSRQTRDRR